MSTMYAQAPVFGINVEVIDHFDEVLKHFRLAMKEDVEALASDVWKEAFDSMEYGGEAKHRRGGGFYESAKAHEPPRYHTEEFRKDMAVFTHGDAYRVGFQSPELALRAAWFEFGGRPLKADEKGKPRKRGYLQHEFLGPALDRVIARNRSGGTGQQTYSRVGLIAA